jgi:hypothetical protein
MFGNNSLIIPSSIISPSVPPNIREKIKNGYLNLAIFGYEGALLAFNMIIKCIQKIPSDTEIEFISKAIIMFPPSARPLFPTFAQPKLVSKIIERWGSKPKINHVFPTLSEEFNLPIETWEWLIQRQNLSFFSESPQILPLIHDRFQSFKNDLSDFLEFQRSISQHQSHCTEITDNSLQFVIGHNHQEAKIATRVTIEKAFRLCKENNLSPSDSNFVNELHFLVSKSLQK